MPADCPTGRRKQFCRVSSLERARAQQGLSQAPDQKQVLQEALGGLEAGMGADGHRWTPAGSGGTTAQPFWFPLLT